MSLAERRQAIPTAAHSSRSSYFNHNDTTIEFTTSNNRSVHSNPYETTETRGSSSALQTFNGSPIVSTSQNQPNYKQQLNCNTSGDETHGDQHSQDCAFNETLQGAFNSAARIFSASGPKCSDAFLKHLPKYIKVLSQQTSLDSSYATESSIQNLSENNLYAEILSSILTLALNTSYLEYFGSRVRNVSTIFLTTREYGKGEMALQEFENYLIQLELVVQAIKDINISLELLNLSVTFESPWVNCILAFGKWENELLKARYRYREVLDMFVKVEVLEVFRRYVDPAVYFAILAVGLVWNGVLLFIFARHRQLWTSANVMIFNLAVGDIVSIIANLPVFYFAHYHVQYFQMNQYVCKFYITLRPLFVAVSALSVVALSILRYIASGTSFNMNSHQCCELSNRSRIIIYVLIVWVLSIGLALPYSVGLKFTAGKCFMYGDGYTAKMVALSEFMFYCVVLPCIMVGFTVLTAKRLKESTKSIPSAMRRTGQDLIRKRSANVLTVLIAVFLISYIPQHLWRVLYRWLSLDIWQVSYRCIDKVTYYLLFANCCFNPISLYGVSKRFRKLYNYYFLYLYNHCNRISKPRLQRLPSLSLHYVNSVQSKF
jgi:hypothetical protein